MNTKMTGFRWFFRNVCVLAQSSKLTQNGTGPVGPGTTRINWPCKTFTGPTNFSLALKEKTLHKIHRQHLF